MDHGREISKPFREKQEQYTSPCFHYPSFSFFTPNHHTNFNKLSPMFSTMEFNTKINNARAEADRENSNSFTPSEEDSSSEAGGDEASDEEVSLDELLRFDGKTKKKIELLAAMVGVDTTAEPLIVLTEVVRVLKLLKTLNQC